MSNSSTTATELLMAVADRMAKHGEGVDVLVVWNDENGAARLKSNCNYTRSLGLASYAKVDIENALLTAEGGDEGEG